ncbi:BQ2448_5174 [Microbotryum intermedium]|uniref:BQ2448_5174 protein n=1 Tax=Microbotryum intermedium TaxID=269621 RepID=A0A238F6C8_9BASI|nr:BQ2448_5174 [Microbotryum intermedium]
MEGGARVYCYYATGSDGFSYGDEPSTTQSTPAPYPGRRCPQPSKGSDGDLVELSGDETTASAGELDNDSDPRGAGQIKKLLLAKKPRLARDRASVQQRAIIQAKKEHMDNALAAMEQRNEDCNIRMMGNLNDMMMTDREKFLKHFYKFEELDQAAWDTVVSYVGACGDALPLSVIT